MTTDLKPCPFCGGEAFIREDTSHSTAFFVGCSDWDCFGNMMWDETEAEARRKWNTRAESAEVIALRARVAELEAEAERRDEQIQGMIEASGQTCACGYDRASDVCLGHYPHFKKSMAEARNKALEEGLARAEKDRKTFCLAMPGTDEEFRAYLDGFDAAIRAMKERDGGARQRDALSVTAKAAVTSAPGFDRRRR